MNYYKHSSNNKLIKIWYGMKSRCYNPKNKDYRLYGAKGIALCDEWLIYENFADWSLSHGYVEGLSIDRVDPKQGYNPQNCEWVTMSENSKRRVKTTPHHFSPSQELRAHFAITTRQAYINDPTLKERTSNFRATNGNTKISVAKLEEIRQAKLCGKNWQHGFELLETKVNVKYFRNIIWNKL